MFSNYSSIDLESLSFLSGMLKDACREGGFNATSDEGRAVARQLVEQHAAGITDPDLLKSGIRIGHIRR
jgi:hypothetical protein